jgi:hypothetical protein
MIPRVALQKIRKEAKELADRVDNPYWVAAYMDLANAADRLDAMTARSSVVSDRNVAQRNVVLGQQP